MLHNMQASVNGGFAYRALVASCVSCKPVGMRVRLREHRERLGLTQEEIAERLGKSVSMVSRWEAGRSNIPSERLSDLARAYECRVSEIFEDDEGPVQPAGLRLPVKGTVAAGIWKEAWELPPEEWEEYSGRADVAVPLRDRFGLRVEGDSMNEVYPPGTILDCVAFYAGVEIANGRRVVVQRRNHSMEFEVTVKEYMREADGTEWLVPRSYNPAFQRPIKVDDQDPEIAEVRIIGVVVGSYRPE